MANTLDDARYVSLSSFKRDGGEVKTPVWAGFVDGKLGIFTSADSYKVKRIRRNPAVRIAKCDARGNVLGPWHDGTCSIVEDVETQRRIMNALAAKYGWQLGILNFFATLTGRVKRRAYLQVTLKE
jgi:PPOX class probable F420-dependent enzyme